MNLSKKPITTEKPKDQESTEESTSIVSTFKLDLTDQERKARDAVQLPYIRYFLKIFFRYLLLIKVLMLN